MLQSSHQFSDYLVWIGLNFCKARRRFIRRYFQVDVSDPLLYNLVVNVDRTSVDEAACMVGETVLSRAAREG